MKFRILETAQALHKILAHSQKLPNGARKINKGVVLSQQDITQLQAANITTIAVAELSADDVDENTAATTTATAVCGKNLSPTTPTHGRVNLSAANSGVLCYAAKNMHALNLESPAITIAALPPFARVTAGQIVATIKIIPYAAPQAAVDAMQKYSQLLTVNLFRQKTIVLVQTEPTAQPSASAENLLNKTRNITEQRLAIRGCCLHEEWRCAHDQESVMATLEKIRQSVTPDLTLIAGASAVCDVGDVIPAAIVASDGTISRFGMPADPGNLLVLGEWQNAPCVVLPGCARSPKHNGLDIVLDRLLADIPLSSDDIAAMGAGGLLEDTAARPSPRRPSRRPNIGALLLAAGASSRMRGGNKLLTLWRDKPLILHAAQTLAAARKEKLVQQTAVICGNQAAEVMAQIAGLDLPALINRNYADGMASSIICGLRALDLQQLDGVLVLLGDMPLVTVEDIRAIVQSFTADAGLVAPTHRNKRGNPVLFGRKHFTAMLNLQGDSGARILFSDEQVIEAAAGPGVLFDLDSPESFTQSQQQESDSEEQKLSTSADNS